MFESLPVDDAAARIRAAAVAPLAAIVVMLGYVTLFPMMGRVPPVLFWSIPTILFAGTLVGAVAIVRVVRSERIRGRALVWLAGAIALDLFCARLFLGLIFPWL